MARNFPKGLTLKLKCSLSEYDGGSAEIAASDSYDDFLSLTPGLRMDIISDAMNALVREKLRAEAALLGRSYRDEDPPSWQSVISDVRRDYARWLIEDEEILFEFDFWSGHDLSADYDRDDAGPNLSNVVSFPTAS
jgi:hypothetical protein